MSTDEGAGLTWVTAYVDVPAEGHAAAAAFWSAVTGWTLSEPRGAAGEFATFLPGGGATPHVRLQRTAAGEPGVHLDLHVPDPFAEAHRAVGLGATVVTDAGDYLVLRSPAGLLLCLVEDGAERAGTTRADGSLVDQVCLDVPAAAFEGECAFWSALTGLALVPPQADTPEFASLARPDRLPLRVLLQRLGADDPGPARAHLDVAAEAGDGTAADELARHEALGARVESRGDGWVVLRDPAGAAYCLGLRRRTSLGSVTTPA